MHTTLDERMALRQTHDALKPTAERLYPDNAYLQQEWIRAVGVVRSTKGGWKCDVPVPRIPAR
jgi:hypothetical protein